MMNNIAFALWANEMDGKLDTRFSKVRKCISYLELGYEPHEAIYHAGLTKLTEAEIEYINNELREELII